MAQSPIDLLKGIAGAMSAQQGAPGQEAAPAPMSREALAALKAQRAPLGNQYGGVNSGGRHDPRAASVYGDSAGNMREMAPPSIGRTMTDKQTNTDWNAMNMVHDAIGGTDISGLAKQDPKMIVQAGLKAVTDVANGVRTPQTTAAAKALVQAVQSRIIPATPEINKLIDAMKRAGLLNQSNIQAF